MIDAAVIIGVEFVVVAIVCGFLVAYYKSPLVTPDVSASVYISWVFGYAAVMILPYDLSVAVTKEEQSSELKHLWVFVYWSTFFLAWAVLPIQMEYHNSGHFTFKEKLFDALRKLFLAALAAFVVAMIYIIYILATKSSSIDQVLGFAMAMSNTYGVLLITVLMGSGLAGIPKRLWAMSNIDSELTRQYLKAPHVEDAYQEARYQLEDCEVEVKKAVEANESSAHSSNKVYIDSLKEKVANFNFANKSVTRAFVKTDPTKNKDYTSKSELVVLHAKLMQCQLRARASERRWRVLIEECKQLKDSQNPDFSEADLNNWCLMPIAANNTPSSTDTPNKVSSMARSFFGPCYFRVYKFWITTLYKPTCRIGAIITAIFSIIILWCEMLMALNLESPIGYMMGAYDSVDTFPVLVQAVAFIALAYMSVCVYWTLFRINIGWYYRLQGPQLSAPSSLVFNAEYLSRIQFSLGYNFLLCLNINQTKYTAFGTIMSNIETIPFFGAQFTVYVPIIMIIIALITLFDLLPRILQLFGIESEESNVTPGQWCQFNSSDKDVTSSMNAELLEKYNTGKTIIDAEIRLLTNLTKDVKERNSLTNARSSVTSESNGSTVSSLSQQYPAKIQISSFDKIRPLNGHSTNYSLQRDEDDVIDDEEQGGGRGLGFGFLGGRSSGGANNTKRNSKRDSYNEDSIFSSTLSINNSTSATSVKNPLREENGKSKIPGLSALTSTSNNKGYSQLPKPSDSSHEAKKNVFSFDDEEDDNPYGGGRYSSY